LEEFCANECYSSKRMPHHRSKGENMDQAADSVPFCKQRSLDSASRVHDYVWGLPTFTLLFLLTVSLWAASEPKSVEPSNESEAAALAVPVHTVTAEVVAVEEERVGTVRAHISSTLQSKVMGRILAVHVQPGDRVQAGQVLVEIDAREIEAQRVKAQAAADELSAALQEVEANVQAAAQAQAAAKAQADLATATYTRFKGLYEQGAVSRQQFDEAEARWKAAQAELARASEMYSAATNRLQQVRAKQEQVAADRRQVESLLDYTAVRAPYEGLVTEKYVNVGDMAAPGLPLVAVEDPTDYRLEIWVPERRLADIALGREVGVVIDALGAQRILGTVVEIVPNANPMSRSGLVKVQVPPLPSLRTGLFGRAFFTAHQAEALTIPREAVFERGQLRGVYVVDGRNVAHLRWITVGREKDGKVEVLSGLDAGERIVAARVPGLEEGSRIQPALP
jgi:multidrug efflux pump subunit AcrA (membrane-fusion protein)